MLKHLCSCDSVPGLGPELVMPEVRSSGWTLFCGGLTVIPLIPGEGCGGQSPELPLEVSWFVEVLWVHRSSVNSDILGGHSFPKWQPARRPKDPFPSEVGHIGMSVRSWLGGQWLRGKCLSPGNIAPAHRDFCDLDGLPPKERWLFLFPVSDKCVYWGTFCAPKILWPWCSMGWRLVQQAHMASRRFSCCAAGEPREKGHGRQCLGSDTGFPASSSLLSHLPQLHSSSHFPSPAEKPFSPLSP